MSGPERFASHRDHIDAIVGALDAGDDARAVALCDSLAAYGDGEGVIAAYLPMGPLLVALAGRLSRP